MSDNGWPGKPGVPLNPERDGWHWIKSLTTEGLMCAEWRADQMGWSLYRSTGEHHPPNMMFSWRYLGPCLTPAEVESHKHAAVIAYTNLLNLPAPPNLIAQARRNALGECISICNAVAHANRVEYPAKWKDRPEGIPHDWQQAWETCAETAENIAAAIRALSDAPSGMVLVPLEPTSAMIQACLQAALDFMAETKTTEVHPGQTYPSASENARRCWRAMVQAAGKGEGDE